MKGDPGEMLRPGKAWAQVTALFGRAEGQV